MANLEKLIPPATRRQVGSLAEYLRRGLGDVFNVPAMVDDVRKQGYPSATNIGLAALGPAGGLQTKIAGGALRLLPIDAFIKGGSLISDAVPVVGKAIKKAAPPTAAAVAMTPATVDEAEAGGLKNLILKNWVCNGRPLWYARIHDEALFIGLQSSILVDFFL